MRVLNLALCLAVAAVGHAQARPGDAIVAKIAALSVPRYDVSLEQNPAKMKAYLAQRSAYVKQRNALTMQLVRTDPRHMRAADLLEQRFNDFEGSNEVPFETYLSQKAAAATNVLASKPIEPLREIAFFALTETRVEAAGLKQADPLPPIERFIKEYPLSERTERLLLLTFGEAFGPTKLAVGRRYLQLYPNSVYSAVVRGSLRQETAIGQPFELSFTDHLTQKPVQIQDFRGKVVLVDFWATWCGPCVAKLPEMLRLQERLGPLGLQIVGVSLDLSEREGGKRALTDFLGKTPLPWPIYYQGNGWLSEFSSNWGIGSIPTVFLVDRQGKLRAINPLSLEAELTKLLGEK